MSTEILFLLIFFIFAVLQGIGQKRKQAGRLGQPPPTDAGEGDVPTGDRERISPRPRERPRVEPSHRTSAQSRETDRPPIRERAPAPAYERPGGTQQPRGGATSSEGLVPKDIWEEIMGLARGEMPSPDPVPTPVPARPSPAESRAGAVPRTAGAESREGAVPRKPSSASVVRRSAPPVAPVPAEGASVPPFGTRRGVRAGLFGDGSPQELRKAIVLKEVLGPPVALRE